MNFLGFGGPFGEKQTWNNGGGRPLKKKPQSSGLSTRGSLVGTELWTTLSIIATQLPPL